MSRYRATAGVLAIVVFLVTSLAVWPRPSRVAGADASDLLAHPPAGWTSSGGTHSDDDDSTFSTGDIGRCYPNCGFPVALTRTSGTFPAVTRARLVFRGDVWGGGQITRAIVNCGGGSHTFNGPWANGSVVDLGIFTLSTPGVEQNASFTCTATLNMSYPDGWVFMYTFGAYAAAGDVGEANPETFGLRPGLYALSKDPVNLATGVFTTFAVDLALPGRGLPFVFERWYNSADNRPGPLGPGWTHSYNWTLSDAGATVEVRRGDGRRDTFTRNPDGTYADPPSVFDALVKNADGTYALTLADQVRYEFSGAGVLTAIREPAGNQISLAYTAGKLTTITDTVARQVTLTYDASDRLTQIQDPLGRNVTYAYDASGRLATAVDKVGNAPGQDPNLHRWQYAYDGTTRHITTITDPEGRVRVGNRYDAQGRVFEQRDGRNELTSFAYGTLQTTVTDPRLHASTYTFDSRMRVLTQTDVVGPNTYVLSYTYDAAGNRTSVTDRNGNRDVAVEGVVRVVRHVGREPGLAKASEHAAVLSRGRPASRTGRPRPTPRDPRGGERSP